MPHQQCVHVVFPVVARDGGDRDHHHPTHSEAADVVADAPAAAVIVLDLGEGRRQCLVRHALHLHVVGLLLAVSRVPRGEDDPLVLAERAPKVEDALLYMFSRKSNKHETKLFVIDDRLQRDRVARQILCPGGGRIQLGCRLQLVAGMYYVQ